MHQFSNIKESSKAEHPVKRYVIPTIHKNNRIDNLHLLKLVKNDNILCNLSNSLFCFDAAAFAL